MTSPPLVLPLDDALLARLAPARPWGGRTFVRKGELHLTVLGGTVGARVMSHPRRAEILARLEAFVAAADPRLEARLTGGALHLRRGPDESLVALLRWPELVDLYREIGREEGLVLPAPVPHVTLYTRGCARGIGVHDQAHLARLQVGPAFALAALLV